MNSLTQTLKPQNIARVPKSTPGTLQTFQAKCDVQKNCWSFVRLFYIGQCDNKSYY